ncbi:porin family protein [Aequorivita vladivostokensis]|uniref:Outer membrane protein beta-barrel domain-containing protein n=1 Tax=Aequorivita vladivostokensis TaxID=171194 RepID=A0ABR5DMG4_9FLAO|nr:outer membrane beta-barrel protein [Aequorivita vladivostokensis]KJJ39945.1 hypothetical protein MB09_01950 [Aequorivita vladivostokensis]
MKSIKLLLLVFFVSFGIQAQELVTGKATLIRTAEGIYEIKKTDGTIKKINIRPNEDKHVQGTLAVLFKDCEELRQSVFESRIVTEGQLIQAVERYNKCNYTTFEPTEKEIEQAANFQGDEYKLFASIGGSLNRISFFNFDDYENLTQGQLSFGVAATPGFIGSLQGSLYFTLEASAAFSGDKDFSNSPFTTNFKKNSYRASLGAEYHFNKKGSIQPLIGIGAGLVRDHYDGKYDGYKIKQTEGSAFLIPKAGVLFSLDDKKSLGVIVSYIPEYENDLTFIGDGDIIPLIIDTHFINASLYLYF